MRFGVMTMASWKHQVSGKKDNKGKVLGLTCKGLASSTEINCSLLLFSMGHLHLYSHQQHCKSREDSDDDGQKSRK